MLQRLILTTSKVLDNYRVIIQRDSSNSQEQAMPGGTNEGLVLDECP
jgi:hypothetical protein